MKITIPAIHRYVLIFIVLLCLPLFACQTFSGTGQDKMQATGTQTVASSQNENYLVQPGDVLDIMVWKEKDLAQTVVVRPDGALDFPLVGGIVAKDKTIKQIREELTTRLTKFVPDPSVFVGLKQALGYKIYVVGQVQKPGEYLANREVDVMQALSLAGGLTPYASMNKIKILRRDINGTLRSISFEYSHVEKGKDLSQNIILHGGDVVVVP